MLGQLFGLRTGAESTDVSMGVRRQWKIQRITSLPIREEVRQQLVADIMRRKQPAITLYAWDVHDGTASEAFFTQEAAIHNWYVKNNLWEKEDIPKGVLIYEAVISVDQLLQHSTETHVQNVALPDLRKIHVGISPSALHEDMQRISPRTLKKQG